MDKAAVIKKVKEKLGAEEINLTPLDNALKSFEGISIEFPEIQAEGALKKVTKEISTQLQKVKFVYTPKYKYKIIKQAQKDVNLNYQQHMEKEKLDSYTKLLLKQNRRNTFKTKFKTWLKDYIDLLKDLKKKYTWLDMPPLIKPFLEIEWGVKE